MFEEVRDFIQAHYHLNKRNDTAYWKAAREEIILSDCFQENLKVWRHATPEVIDLDSAYLFSSPVHTLLLIAKGFYKDASLARASTLSRTAYDRYRTAERKARPGQLPGLISHAEFLKTGGKAAASSLFTGLHSAEMAVAPCTKIKLPAQPARPRSWLVANQCGTPQKC